MASKKVIASIELSKALGLPVGTPVTPAKLKQEVKRHTKPAGSKLSASTPIIADYLKAMKKLQALRAKGSGSRELRLKAERILGAMSASAQAVAVEIADDRGLSLDPRQEE